jgi:hypothetical protein
MQTGASRRAVRAIADLAFPILLEGVILSAFNLGVLNPQIGIYSGLLGLGLGALMVCYYLGFMMVLHVVFRVEIAGTFLSLLCGTIGGAVALWTVNLLFPSLVIASFTGMLLAGFTVTLVAAVQFGLMILVGLMEPIKLAWLPRRRRRD